MTYIHQKILRLKVADLDPDPTIYLNADPDLGSQTNVDPCGSGSWSDFAVISWILTLKMYGTVLNYSYEVTEAILKG